MARRRRAAGCVLARAISEKKAISRTCEIRVFTHRGGGGACGCSAVLIFAQKCVKEVGPANCNYTWAATKPSPDCHASAVSAFCPHSRIVLTKQNCCRCRPQVCDGKWIRSFFYVFSF